MESTITTVIKPTTIPYLLIMREKLILMHIPLKEPPDIRLALLFYINISLTISSFFVLAVSLTSTLTPCFKTKILSDTVNTSSSR